MSKYDPTRPVSSMKHDDKRVAIPPKTSREIIHNSQLIIHSCNSQLSIPNSQLSYYLHTKHSTLNTKQKYTQQEK